MKKTNNSANQIQFDLFEPDTEPDKLNSTDNLNNDSLPESNLYEDSAKDEVCEKSFDYQMGSESNSVVLTYIDYDCPQALKAHETITESLNRLTQS